MRVLVHDYAGHPFQVQLSRHLARRGHEVLHIHCPSYRSGKGALSRGPGDPASFAIAGIEVTGVMKKYSRVRRVFQELVYGRQVAKRMRRFAPDVVLSSNAPLFAQGVLVLECRRQGVRFVFWQQDIYSFGMRSAVAGLPLVGVRLGELFCALERRLLLMSDAVVIISADFVATLERWGVPSSRVHVIENWAPLDELPRLHKDNQWSREVGLAGKTVLLYSGTLGRKHNPDLLLQLAISFRSRPDVVVAVASEGLSMDWLAKRKDELQLDNLTLLPFQPYDRLPEVLASADVLLVLLEHDAGVFAVPSKVLTYQCAGRPLLGAIPAENLASRVVRESRSGLTVDSEDAVGFVRAAETLVADPGLRSRLGENARKHASEAFDIERITDRFESVLDCARENRSPAIIRCTPRLSGSR